MGILIKLALVMFYGHRTGRRDGELAQSSYEAIVKLVKGAVHRAPLTGRSWFRLTVIGLARLLLVRRVRLRIVFDGRAWDTRSAAARRDLLSKRVGE